MPGAWTCTLPLMIPGRPHTLPVTLAWDPAQPAMVLLQHPWASGVVTQQVALTFEAHHRLVAWLSRILLARGEMLGDLQARESEEGN